jgi:hypothetical protein
MYPSVMAPLPERLPYARPTWPPDANPLTRAIAEAILAERGLLHVPPSPVHAPAALRSQVRVTRAHTAALGLALAQLFAASVALRQEAKALLGPPD